MKVKEKAKSELLKLSERENMEITKRLGAGIIIFIALLILLIVMTINNRVQ